MCPYNSQAAISFSFSNYNSVFNVFTLPCYLSRQNLFLSNITNIHKDCFTYHAYSKKRHYVSEATCFRLHVITIIIIWLTCTFGHLFTSSGITRLEVSLMISPGSFCLFVCRFLVFYPALGP